MEEYKALDSLEDRVEKLMSIVSGKTPIDEINVSKTKPIIDALHEVDTVLISTLSGREKITSLLKKTDILEKVLNPSYLEITSNLDSKVEAILESESNIKCVSQSLTRFDELEPALNSDVKELSSVSDRLINLMSNLANIKRECNNQTVAIQRLIVEYNEAMMFLTKLFVQLESSITELENDSKSKPHLN